MSARAAARGNARSYSLTTARAVLSSRRPTNLECRRWSSAVHSKNSNCPTSTGFSHRHAAIFACVRPCPHRPLRASGKLTNGTLVGHERAELLEELRPDGRREPVARPRDVDQVLACVVPEDECVEGAAADRVAADHELLSSVHAHLHPGARPQPRLVDAGAALGDQTLEALRFDGLDQHWQLGVEARRVPDGRRPRCAGCRP